MVCTPHVWLILVDTVWLFIQWHVPRVCYPSLLSNILLYEHTSLSILPLKDIWVISSLGLLQIVLPFLWLLEAL